MADLYEITLEPNPETVHYFKDLLARAETGEIQGFAIVIHKSKGLTANGWTGLMLNPMAIIGEIEAMQMDLINANVDQRFDCCGDSTD